MTSVSRIADRPARCTRPSVPARRRARRTELLHRRQDLDRPETSVRRHGVRLSTSLMAALSTARPAYIRFGFAFLRLKCLQASHVGIAPEYCDCQLKLGQPG